MMRALAGLKRWRVYGLIMIERPASVGVKERKTQAHALRSAAGAIEAKKEIQDRACQRKQHTHRNPAKGGPRVSLIKERMQGRGWGQQGMKQEWDQGFWAHGPQCSPFITAHDS